MDHCLGNMATSKYKRTQQQHWKGKTMLLQVVSEEIDSRGEGNIDATHMFSDHKIEKVFGICY
jgi:hypothetical protein